MSEISASTEPRILRTTQLLDRVRGNAILFTNRDEDTDTVKTHLGLTRQQWEDLGRPEQLTVTIEPGDLLNEQPT